MAQTARVTAEQAWDTDWATLRTQGLVCVVYRGPEEGVAASRLGPGA